MTNENQRSIPNVKCKNPSAEIRDLGMVYLYNYVLHGMPGNGKSMLSI